MSAEKDIVNYWCNKRGLFTINNIKLHSKDLGILALRFDKGKINEIMHIEVNCSITNNILEAKSLDKSIDKLVQEKFYDEAISDKISNHTKQFSAQTQQIKNIIVVGAMPKSRKNQIIREFNQRGVEVIELESILYEVVEQLDTQYYRNDIIRTLQLVKYLLFSDAVKLANLTIDNALSSNSRKEFLSSILDKKEMVREFKKTNIERLSIILKNAGLKPKELAWIVENHVLNKRTRKLFLNSLIEHESARKSANNLKRDKKLETPLERFF